jgi:integrase
MPRTVAKPWETRLRQTIKGAQGEGWLLRAGRGERTQIIRSWEDGSRSSAMVPIKWDRTNATKLAALVERLASLMSEQELGLQEAVELASPSEEDSAGVILAGKANWIEIAARFESELVGRGVVAERTYKREGRLYVQRTLELLCGQNQVKDGSGVLSGLVENYPLTPGSVGRKRMLSYAARFLNYGVDRCGAAKRFRPPVDRGRYEGQRSERPSVGTPVLDRQFIRLLSSMSNSRWKLAVGLAGVFGLRPFEIWHCQPEGNGLRIPGIKRNKAGRSADRLVLALDPEGSPGLGEELIDELNRNGEEALPPIKRSWGERMNHYLKREVPTWGALIEESTATNKRSITPYGFRHGYAWRGSQLYGLTPRVLASLMGHTVAIHLKHYGQWANETETAEAVKRAIEQANAKGIESTDGRLTK